MNAIPIQKYEDGTPINIGNGGGIPKIDSINQ